jgi:hypothetical protein
MTKINKMIKMLLYKFQMISSMRKKMTSQNLMSQSKHLIIKKRETKKQWRHWPKQLKEMRRKIRKLKRMRQRRSQRKLQSLMSQ